MALPSLSRIVGLAGFPRLPFNHLVWDDEADLAHRFDYGGALHSTIVLTDRSGECRRDADAT